MATGYSIEIGEGSSLVTLDANLKFSLRPEATPSDAGVPDTVKVQIEAEGDFYAATASAVADRIFDVLLPEVETGNNVPRKVVIKLGGTARRTYEVADCIGSPIVSSFEVTPDDDGGESHLHWRLSIFCLLLARNQSPADAAELTTSLEVTKVNGEVVRKVWRAAAKSRTAAEAKAAILTYKPGETDIKEIIETFAQEARATAVWIWDPRDEQNRLKFEETLTITPGAQDYLVETQVGPVEEGDTLGEPPVLHELPPRAWEAQVVGRVSGYKDAEGNINLEPPPGHWPETESGRRAHAREKRYEVEPDPDVLTNGLYHRRYEEYWIFTLEPDTPDHGDHGEPLATEPPADGQVQNK